MIAGLSGSLLSHEALEQRLPDGLNRRLDEAGRHAARSRIRAWHLPLRTQLGPASSARTCFDRLAAPLFAQLGYHVLPLTPTENTFRALLVVADSPAVALVVTPWGQDANRAWREAVHLGIVNKLSWCFCATGPAIRVMDTRRTYSRRFVEFSLDRALDDEQTFAVFWGLLRADAMSTKDAESRPLLEHAVHLSEEHRGTLRASLQHGVHEALEHLIRAFASAGRQRLELCRAFDESLIVVYRILFLLFAEARGMVPQWHPVFRDAYTIESVRVPVERLPRPRGLWETLQAISRLAHRGCHIGSLRVTAFNGRLFSPADSPLSESTPLDDGEVRQAVLALTTRAVRHGRVSISYGDLGVEQLGGIYERLLDFESSRQMRPRVPALVRSSRRKSTGAFYTPRSVADYLVRRTLAPLVRDASPEQILALRVLDPAMGSGAFLVSACRYLSAAYEAALIREGGISSEDIDDRERAGFRRAVAQQCLFGVDINPMAVQVGRLSLWLATLSADRPLTFLDHRLRTGNSLAGASLDDVARQPPTKRGRYRRPVLLPLFGEIGFDAALSEAVGIRSRIATGPADTLEQVRSKERALAEVNRATSRLTCLKEVADLWCSPWYAPDDTSKVLASAFGALADEILERSTTLPAHRSTDLRQKVRAIACGEGFFHWTLEFPEVFFDSAGIALTTPGFDAIVGNPPWEMLRGDSGEPSARAAARCAGAKLTAFARGSGVYRFQGDGHGNLYQLFLERALTLLRANGRLGFVLPSGFAVDRGSAALRRALLDVMNVDSLVSVENRAGLFPIHRGLTFLLLSASKSGPTTLLPCRFGIRSPTALDALPETGTDADSITIARTVIERSGGAGLAIPRVQTAADLEILTQITFEFPALGDPDGWNVHFGRELNATEDRRHFVEVQGGVTQRGGLPVIEGKQIVPFGVDIDAVGYRIPRGAAARLLPRERTFGRPRLAYRDVAASTNRLSLIAAIIPAGAVTTHTLFCLKEDLSPQAQQYLCGMFNSFVANYLVRLRINTHVGATMIDRLPVPKPRAEDPFSREIAQLAAKLSSRNDQVALARLQAIAACLYGLRHHQFAHVLETFPLIAVSDRDAAMAVFCDIVDPCP